MPRVIVVVLVAVLGAGCASEELVEQEGTSCCLGGDGGVFGPSGCAVSSVISNADGRASVSLPWCAETYCGRRCAGLEDSPGDYAGCLGVCRGSRTRIP